jgi:hypothetical protein
VRCVERVKQVRVAERFTEHTFLRSLDWIARLQKLLDAELMRSSAVADRRALSAHVAPQVAVEANRSTHSL